MQSAPTCLDHHRMSSVRLPLRPRLLLALVVVTSVVLAACSAQVAPTPSSSSLPASPSATPQPSVGESASPAPSDPVAVGWEAAAVPDTANASGIAAIVAGGDGLIAISFDGGFGSLVWTSVDGRTWTDITPDGFESIGISGVVEFDGMLVAVGRGNTIDIESEEAAVYLSRDGTEWRKVETAEPMVGQLIDLVATDDGLYAVGGVPGADSAGIWHSADGESWERIGPDIEHAFLWSIAEGGPGLVAVGWRRDPDPSTAVWTSVDGSEWTLSPDPEGYELFEATDVVNLDGTLVMVGSSLATQGGRFWTSADGLEWTVVDVPGLQRVYPRTLLETAAGLIAVGGGESMAGTAWISADGRAWEPFGDPLDGSYFHGAVVHDGSLVVGGATQAGTLETGIESHAAIWSTPLDD
jgi:hypothetical protein